MSKNVVLNNLNKDREQRGKGIRPLVAGETVQKLVGFKVSAGLNLKWSQICDRYTNDFDYSAEQDAKLIEEIREFGLQHPPIVVSINKYLNLDGVPEKARAYYEAERKNGYEYFIISGHRRSRAVMSLCYGKQIGLDKTEFREWYKEKFGGMSPEAAALENRWATVEAGEYEPKSVELEEKLTQVENFSNRIIKTFTWVYNSYKMLSEKEKVTAEDVTEYVNGTYGVNLSSGSIGNYLTVIRTMTDERYIRAIFNGSLTTKQAKNLCPYYSLKLSNNAQLRDEVISNICSGTDVDEYIEKLKGKKKSSKKPAKEKLTKKVVLELIEKVIKNELTAEEMKEQIDSRF